MKWTPKTQKLVIRAAVPIIAVAIIGISMLFSPAKSQAKEIKIAFWNVENLFDSYKDPRLNAEDILTPKQVSLKLAKDAEIIKHLDADIIGLSEVENHQILRELVTRHLTKQGYHYFILLEGKDTRGIDTAIISKRPFMVRSFALPNFPRGVLAARFSIKGQPLYVLVNHWKSRRQGGESVRIKSAKTVLQIVKQEIRRYEGRDVPIVVGGDLNDTDSNQSLKVLTDGGMVNTLKNIPAKDRWTIGRFNSDANRVELSGFDHILINKTLAEGKNIRWKSSKVVRPRMMVRDRVIRGKHYDMPLDDYKDRIGYSDHYPVMTTLEISEN